MFQFPMGQGLGFMPNGGPGKYGLGMGGQGIPPQVLAMLQARMRGGSFNPQGQPFQGGSFNPQGIQPVPGLNNVQTGGPLAPPPSLFAGQYSQNPQLVNTQRGRRSGPMPYGGALY